MNTYTKQLFSLLVIIALCGNNIFAAEPEKRSKKPDVQQPKKEPASPLKPATPEDNDSPAFLAATIFNANSPSLLTSLISNKALLTELVHYYKQQDPNLKPARIIKVFNHIPSDSRAAIIEALQSNNYTSLPPFNTLSSLVPAHIVDAPCQVQNPQTPTNDQAAETLADYAIKYIAIAAAQENTTNPQAINVTPDEFATDAIQYLNYMRCSTRVVNNLKPVMTPLIKEAKELESVRIAAIAAGKASLAGATPTYPDPEAIRGKLKTKIGTNSTAEHLLNLYAQALAQAKEKGAGQSNQALINNNPFLNAALTKYQQTPENALLTRKTRDYLIAGVLISIGTALNTFLSQRTA